MNKQVTMPYAVFFLSGLLSACAIGFDHTLFVTKSNVGIDIDTRPPTAEISIARREIVIAPTFEGGQTPPILAGFRTANRLLFGFDVSSVFAGGDAALILPKQDAGAATSHDAKLCMNRKPVGKPSLGPISFGQYPLAAAGDIRPFVFGTDTTFGLKVAWSGMTAQFPDSLKLGFNRKELALAPVYGKEEIDQACPYSVEMPAFLASIEIASNVASPQSVQSTYRQSFSTGAAAVSLAKDPYIKKLILTRLDRYPDIGIYEPDRQSECISHWLLGDETKKVARSNDLKAWLQSNDFSVNEMPLFISDKKYAEARVKFIEDKQIHCEER